MKLFHVFPIGSSKIRKKLSHIKNYINVRIEDLQYWYYLSAWKKNNVYLIGTPLHTNVGDIAIAYAEILYLKECGIQQHNIKEITVDEYLRYKKIIIKSLFTKKRLICMHGGGNMGNQWLNEEIFRRNVMRQLPNNPMIIFPQTFFYSDDAEGKCELEKSIPYYSKRKNLSIFARERKSFELMKEAYPYADINLSPDIVLSIDQNQFGIQKCTREGVLLVFRSDGERIMKDSEKTYILKMLQREKINAKITDMITDMHVEKNNRKTIISEKLNQFASSKLVITDRLHAMVFAAVSNTPCIVFSNNNHKIQGTYEWIHNLPYIRFVDNIDVLANTLDDLYDYCNAYYDNKELKPYYNKLQEVIEIYS